MDQNMEMKWEMRLYGGLEGLGFPRIRGLFGCPHNEGYWSIWGALILGHYLLGSEFKVQRFLMLSVPGLLLGWK